MYGTTAKQDTALTWRLFSSLLFYSVPRGGGGGDGFVGCDGFTRKSAPSSQVW